MSGKPQITAAIKRGLAIHLAAGHYTNDLADQANKIKKRRLTERQVELLRQQIAYDPTTGALTARLSTGGRSVGSDRGCRQENGYTLVRFQDELWTAHNIAWAIFFGEYPHCDIDHINGDKSDNRICNLRIATRSHNNANKSAQANNMLGIKGVRTHSNGSFTSQIGVSVRGSRKQLYLGSFECEDLAHLVYATAADRLFGDFARTQ